MLIPFSNNERIANNEWQSKLYTNEKGVYNFQLNYFLQKQIASKHLKEFYGVSLKKNNIIHGNFYSNTVKFKIDSIYRDF